MLLPLNTIVNVRVLTDYVKSVARVRAASDMAKLVSYERNEQGVQPSYAVFAAAIACLIWGAKQIVELHRNPS
jgi:hypothetical protein